MAALDYISVCSGIEAATVAWHPLGWRPLVFAEVDKFPSKVLRHHYPDVPNHGDFTTMKGNEYGAADVLVGGTPCQDFSVAGLRAGLDGKRGQLTIEYAALSLRARTRWLVWENVPGVLSIDAGEAFAVFLSALCGRNISLPQGGWQNAGVVEGASGAYGLAYRVLDAQYFGVPQRRRRVFVVGHLGDWRRAAAVLFERHCLSGHPAPRREARQVAPTIPSRRTGGGGLGSDFDFDGGLIAGTLSANGKAAGSATQQDAEGGMILPVVMSTGQASAEIGIGIGIGTTLHCGHEAPILAHALRGEGFDASEDGTGRGTPLVPVAIQNATRGKDQNDLGICQDGTMNTLDQGSQHAVAIQAGALRENPESGPDGVGVREDGLAYTLEARAEVQAVAFRASGQEGFTPSRISPPITSTDGGGAGVPTLAFTCKDYGADLGDTSPTLRAMGHDGSHANAGGQIAVALSARARGDDGRGYNRPEHVSMDLSGTLDGTKVDRVLGPYAMAVRRLTPRECERLQGFPDDYTKISEKTADGPRYKALGNSMAVPVMAWIGKRIQIVEGVK